ncbi:uncharacterized protein LOC142578014 [Dermacentor variabilis]|uniref:uncharacterized protein LOC142578014 n=1 Tax=Dermacentor variabilis TaxID=34621 RepID=UPI003F5CA5CC
MLVKLRLCTTMLLTVLLAISSLNLGHCDQQVKHPYSPPRRHKLCFLQYTIKVDNKPVHTYVDNCTCKLKDGTISYFPENTRCYVPAVGYDNEFANRPGLCKGGTCVPHTVPFGCAGIVPRTRKSGDPLQLGCTFTCYNEAEGRTEFGYYPEGTPCLHYNNKTNIETTCKKSGNEVICREKLDTVPGC